MTEWNETTVKWTYGYPLKIRTDGTRWQIFAQEYIPTPSGPLDEYLNELKEACARLDDPKLDTWIEADEFTSNLLAKATGWRAATAKETERIDRIMAKQLK